MYLFSTRTSAIAAAWLAALPIGAAAATAAAGAPAAIAASPSPSSSPSPAVSPAPGLGQARLPEIGRVFASDRQDESIRLTSRPTYVVTRAQMDARGDRTVADALQTVPGVNLFSYGGFGAQTDYSIRGSGSSTRTLVLLNGIPIANASSETVDINQFSTAGVDRLEVVESGSSTLYGTSASGGVINIVTRPLRGTDAAVSAGSYGDRDARVTVGDGRFGFALERHVAANDYPYPAFAYSAAASPAPLAGVRTGAYAAETTGRADLATSLRGFDVRGSAALTAVHFGIPGHLAFGATPDDSQDTSRADAQLEVGRTLGAHTLSATIAGAREQFASYEVDEGTGQSDTYDGRAQLSLKDVVRGSRVNVVGGVDLARESASLTVPTFGVASAPPNFGANESQSAAYLQATATVARTSRVNAGLRAEADNRLGVAGSSERDALIAPSVGFLANLGSARLAANLDESFRVPTLVDLYYPGYANAALRPEKSANVDATLALDLPGGGTASAGFFGQEAANYIVLDASYIPQNEQHASLAGLMFDVTSRPLYGVVTSLDVTDTYRAIDRATGARVPRTPVVTSILNIERPLGPGRVGFGIRARIIGGDGDDGPNASAVYDAYTKLDGYLRYRLAPGAIVTARVLNAGNQQYAPVYGYPAPGRTFALELSTR